LKKAQDDTNRNLDMISFLRRIRMHGIALTVLLKKEDRLFISSFAKKKTVDDIDLTTRKHWNKIESLSYKERIGAGMLNRYHAMRARIDRDLWHNLRPNPYAEIIKKLTLR